MSQLIAKVFDFEDLDKQERIQRTTLIRILLFTCLAGFAYSALYMYVFEIWGMADVVLTYIGLSFSNLVAYYYFKNYNVFRVIQLVFITFLPIICQLFIGGFMASSAVGISGLLAPIGSLLFYNVKVARRLMFVFVFLLIAAGVIEYHLLDKISAVPRNIEIIFFVIILAFTSIVIYALLEYVIIEKKKISDQLEQMYFKLESRKQEIEIQNLELRSQKLEILSQKADLEEKNKLIQKSNDEIKASIKYASTIQNALLPGTSKMSSFFNESFFTLYKPRDVVSGDFYWCEQIDNKVILVSSDCTGHGVPGAFMSMLGVSGLNLIVFQKEITSPDLILNHLHDFIFKSLHQEDNMSSDGMDISVVVFDRDNKTLEFAGAMNPLYFVHNDKVVEVKGNKQPVGGLHYGSTRSYTKTSVNLDGVDMIYLASDGYQDQFGGCDNQKFMKKRFKQELLKIHQLPTQEQKRRLDDLLNSWMKEGAEKQIDDVLVMGVRVN